MCPAQFPWLTARLWYCCSDTVGFSHLGELNSRPPTSASALSQTCWRSDLKPTCLVRSVGAVLAGQRPVAPFLHQLSFSPDTGIECPRGARNLPGLVQEGEPFSEEATLFTKELVLQREVGHLPAASCMRRGEKNDVFLPCQRSVCHSFRCSAFHIHAPPMSAHILFP